MGGGDVCHHAIFPANQSVLQLPCDMTDRQAIMTSQSVKSQPGGCKITHSSHSCLIHSPSHTDTSLFCSLLMLADYKGPSPLLSSSPAPPLAVLLPGQAVQLELAPTQVSTITCPPCGGLAWTVAREAFGAHLHPAASACLRASAAPLRLAGDPGACLPQALAPWASATPSLRVCGSTSCAACRPARLCNADVIPQQQGSDRMSRVQCWPG
jgi:hypothetical protein